MHDKENSPGNSPDKTTEPIQVSSMCLKEKQGCGKDAYSGLGSPHGSSCFSSKGRHTDQMLAFHGGMSVSLG
jgi:hypothetical protein